MPASKEEIVKFKEGFRAFLQSFPLYTKFETKLPEYPSGLRVSRIFLWCDVCKFERPFTDRGVYGSGAGLPAPKLEDSNYRFGFTCTGCNVKDFEYWFQVSVTSGWVRKIGQNPEWSIKVNPAIEKNLGDDLGLYKKALILMSQSYGLGACIYLRRIVENQINPMLELIGEIRTSEGLEDKAAEVEEALNGKVFDNKMTLAAELLPPSLIVDGFNPVKLIYDELSKSIHSLSDNEAMDVAMRVRTAFEYVIVELRQQLARRREFIEGLKAIRG